MGFLDNTVWSLDFNFSVESEDPTVECSTGAYTDSRFERFIIYGPSLEIGSKMINQNVGIDIKFLVLYHFPYVVLVKAKIKCSKIKGVILIMKILHEHHCLSNSQSQTVLFID